MTSERGSWALIQSVVVVLTVLGAAGCQSPAATEPWHGSDASMQDAASYGHPDAGMTSDAGCEQSADYATFVQPLFSSRCLGCHSSALSSAQRNQAPDNVNFDTEADIVARAALIRARAIEQRNMPPGAPLDDCSAARLAAYLDRASETCVPTCGDHLCGSDGCGGECGRCDASQLCDSGRCVAIACTGSCESAACGDDGCGSSCGDCALGMYCTSDRQCLCSPKCDGKSCGDDGCGGTCGSCAANQVCTLSGQCSCVPSCSGKLCGDDGCGGSCGSCASNEQCSADQTACVCVPACAGKVCGADGCGGSCGMCQGALVCNTRVGQCKAACTPDCTGRVCGDDGCGGTCGAGCSSGQTCTSAGQCVCAPSCLGRACGNDGCGGSCGSCAQATSCNGSGQCVCTPDCVNRSCGDDGCGGTCGSCSGAQVCSSGVCLTQCVPSCSGKVCGDDGCGGSCGGCSQPQACTGGQCTWPSKSFGADVYPIFQSAGCAGNACHAGARPAEGLDLSSQALAFQDLVNVSSKQCTSRKLVQPSSPAMSYLLNKLSGIDMCSGSRMPKGGSALTSTQMDIISSWIGSGAVP